MPKIFIFGCGYLGLYLVEEFIESGFEVGALTKNASIEPLLKKRGVNEVLIDRLESKDWHNKLSSDYTHIVNCVSSSGNGINGYKLSYNDGMISILDWLKNQSKKNIIYTSSTSVYGQNDGTWVDESSISTSPNSEYSNILRKTEDLIVENKDYFSSHYIIRLSGIYGPNRHYLLDSIRSKSAINSNKDYFMNMIHVKDITKAICRFIHFDGKIESGIYNLTDNQPVKRKEVANWISSELGMPPPEFNISDDALIGFAKKRTPKNRKISNSKIKKALTLNFSYPSFKEGYKSILETFY